MYSRAGGTEPATTLNPAPSSKLEPRRQADSVGHSCNHGQQVQVDAHRVVPGERPLLEAHLLADARRIVVLLSVPSLCAAPSSSASDIHHSTSGLRIHSPR